MADKTVPDRALEPTPQAADAADTQAVQGARHLFPKAWALLPANGRYLTLLAERCGLRVTHDGGAWTWAGTRAQFEASGIFPRSTNWSFRRKMLSTSEGLFAQAYRDEATDLITIGVHEFFPHIRKVRRDGATLQRAAGDHAWLTFRDRLLDPALRVSLDCEEGS